MSKKGRNYYSVFLGKQERNSIKVFCKGLFLTVSVFLELIKVLILTSSKDWVLVL